MSPYEQIKAAYEASDHDKPWLEMIEWYAKEGFVFLTPAYCAIGIEIRFEEKDCWYVAAASGDLSRMWDVLPYPLPWIAFKRMLGGKEDLRLHRTEDLRRLSPCPDPYG